MVEDAKLDTTASFRISVADSGKLTAESDLPDIFQLPDRKAFVDTPNCEYCGAPFGAVISGRHHW